ncbi:MAG: YiiX/YebB-like N1pC/P60 family cysteine hydrolase [Isosphaeraceae bacterium]
MTNLFFLFLPLFLNPPEPREMSERIVPPGFQGNYYGPEATKARREGRLSPIQITPQMARWDDWARKYLRDGDILFRQGDARVLKGFFPMSRFYANCSNSKFSHTGIVAFEEEGPVVYDTTGTGVARQPFSVWTLDNVGNFGVKRLRPESRGAVPKILAYCRKVFREQPPFDYELGLDDKALYCVEMTEKAFRAAGIPLSEPVRLGDMERAAEFPVCMLGLAIASKFVLDNPLTLETAVYFPGNDRHGIWSSPHLMVIVAPTFKPGYPYMTDHGLPLVADTGN